ncbi:MAG: aspartate/glutamate racemase family protein [Pseudomonadota bacterium]
MFPPGARRLGILMLDTRFPRPMGDLGNPASWGVPTELLVVHGIGPADAVQSAQELRRGPVLEAFCDAVAQLQRRGVAAITTSCGFLAPLQRDLQRAASVPVVTSSLTLLPSLLAQGGPVGVLTINAQRLGADHFLALGISHAQLSRLVVEGMPAGTEFSRSILGNHESLDTEKAADEVVAAALRLKAREPAVRALVLECTNMPPYAQRIRQATGFRVLSLLDSPLLGAALAADHLAAY